MRKRVSSFRLINRSGYDNSDLRRFLERAFRACGLAKRILVRIYTAPGRTKGCADIAGSTLTLAIAAPSRLSMRRLANVTTHEVAHAKGWTHSAMGRRSETLLYSPDRGPTPYWARGAKLRWKKRAPPQLRSLRQDRVTRA